MFLILLLFSAAFGEKTAFEQALEQNLQVPTEERTVDVGGKRYREVRYQGKKYYLRFLGPTEEAELDCSMDSKSVPSLAEMGVSVYKRSKVFVSMLSESCEVVVGGRTKRVIKIDPRLGFTIPDDQKSVIKNKKVYIGPGGPGFSGEW